MELVLEMGAVPRAREDPDGLPPRSGPGMAGLLEGAPRHLDEEPLLRIHPGGVVGRDPEERVIERVRVIQERSPLAVRGPRLLRSLPVVLGNGEAIPWHLSHRAAALEQEPPEAVEIGGTGGAGGGAGGRERGR